MLAARTRCEVLGPPVCRHCGNVIEVVSKMDRARKWCSALYWQAVGRQRQRERLAAEAKYGPRHPARTGATALIATDSL